MCGVTATGFSRTETLLHARPQGHRFTTVNHQAGEPRKGGSWADVARSPVAASSDLLVGRGCFEMRADVGAYLHYAPPVASRGNPHAGRPGLSPEVSADLAQVMHMCRPQLDEIERHYCVDALFLTGVSVDEGLT